MVVILNWYSLTWLGLFSFQKSLCPLINTDKDVIILLELILLYSFTGMKST